MNSRVPLSQGIAKQAAQYDLNADQIQRCVEASNTIAHLKIREITDDRTVEFPLAKFAEVMKLVSLPESLLDKKAGWDVETDTTNDHVESTAPDDTNTHAKPCAQEEDGDKDNANAMYAASIDDDEMFHRGDREKMAYFIREAAINRQRLQELDDRSMVILPTMQKIAEMLRMDDKGLDKMAVALQDDEFRVLTKMVYGESQTRRDFGEAGAGMFKEAEMRHVKTIASLYKEARELVREQSQRRDMDKRASDLEQIFTKQAAGVAGAMGQGLGRAMGGMARGAVMGPARGAANMLGRGVNAAGKAAGMAKSLVGGVKPAGRIGALGAIGGLASVGLDAAMYSPGVDENGQSKDVWSALQQS